MRIGFIGCVESSYNALATLIDMEEVEIVAVVTLKESSFNSDFVDLSELCFRHNIPCMYEDLNDKSKTLSFFKKYQLDVIYCFGWSYLLGKELLSLAPKGVIGYHPAKLPQNRGRHPIIWSLVLGLKETASTFFQMDAGADSGPIISQKNIQINLEDDAKSLYLKVLESAMKQIPEFTLALAENRCIFREQDHDKATYWRKRSKKDGLIDWRMPASSIHNLIKALTDPYPGAEFKWRDTYISVKQSKLDGNIHPMNIEPGKILARNCNDLLIKCAYEDAIWVLGLNDIDLPEVGGYL